MISIKVPPLGESIVEATVSRWLKKQGDTVATGDMIVELETDKITVEVPAPRAGVLSSLAVAEGDIVKVDQLLGEMDETADAPAAPAAPAAEAPSSVASAPSPASTAAAPAPAPAAAPATPQKTSPAARREAADAGVSIDQVAGTGRGGVVSKPDVLEHASKQVPPSAASAAKTPSTPAPQAAPAPSPVAAAGERETREKMSTRRKRIAENLLHSQHSTAHLTTFNEVDMTAVNALRERMKEKVMEEHNVKLTFMPFFIKAACMALDGFPLVNAQIDDDTIVYRHYVNMGIAVASDAGLVVPNIKDAQRKGILELTRDMTSVAKRARDGKLTMDDLTGGTFTITNGGVFGSLVSTPIINYPQV
ncbi:MAG: 2-oxo acid dehydrogenase subunit E2, partial [Gemmatimonadaceae bacterium]